MVRSIRRLFDGRRALPFSLVATLALAACGGGSETPEGEAPAQAETPAQGGDMIIVTQAAGPLGSLVVDELLERGVAASRLILVSPTPDELDRYVQMGASARSGNFSQPSSLPAAFAGGDRMLLVSLDDGTANRANLHKNAIDAAVAAGVTHIAYTSLVDLENNTSPMAADHRQTEQFLRESGVATTMLRNNLFMDPLVDTAIMMLTDGRVESSELGISYVAERDAAAAAAVVLATGAHDNQVFDITGPEVIYPQDIGRALAEETEMPIRIMDGSGGPPTGPLSSSSFSVLSDAVQTLTGRPPLSIHDLFEIHHDDLMAGTGA